MTFSGLIAATYTPLNQDGSLHVEAIPPIVEHLIGHGVAGMYVLGSTGEGLSLTVDERHRVAEAFVRAAAGRLPVMVQVGSESLAQARELAADAQAIGADAVSAVSPVYFKPDSVDSLVDSMAEIAAGAPALPFYYYHIPTLTGVDLPMLDFLARGSQQMPTLRGIKFTSTNLMEFQACIEFDAKRFTLLWGTDEMLLGALTAGAGAAVGSTYNFAAPIYQRLLEAWAKGNVDEARRWQSRSQQLVRTFVPYGPRAAQKAIMAMIGLDCGPSRLPIANLSPMRIEALRSELQAIGFFAWIVEASAATPVEEKGKR